MYQRKGVVIFSPLFSSKLCCSLARPRTEWAASSTPGDLPQLLLHAEDGQGQVEPSLLHVGLQEPDQLETVPRQGSGGAGGEQEQEEEQGRQVEQDHSRHVVRRVGSFKVRLQSVTGEGIGSFY